MIIKSPFWFVLAFISMFGAMIFSCWLLQVGFILAGLICWNWGVEG